MMKYWGRQAELESGKTETVLGEWQAPAAGRKRLPEHVHKSRWGHTTETRYEGLPVTSLAVFLVVLDFPSSQEHRRWQEFSMFMKLLPASLFLPIFQNF